MSARDFDCVVIGSGSAGLTAAKGVANWGGKVALVDKSKSFGGDCTWSGCVPSKALIRCARACHEAKSSARFGVVGVDPDKVKCDWPAVQKHVRDSQQYIYDHDDAPKVLQNLGVVTITNRVASFVDKYTLKLEKVEATDSKEENQIEQDTITADSFIICTGAGPWIPPIAGVKDVPYMTYEDIFEMKEFPEHLMVIGGGPIGAELAQAFRRLGAEVTSIDIKMLEREDEDVREVMNEVFETDGIKFVSGFAKKASKGGKGIVVEVEDPKSKTITEVTGTHLLVASGRRPRGLEALKMDSAGIKWSPKGVEVDSKLRTNVAHIFACGDCVAGAMQFTHLAGFHGATAALNSLIPVGMASPPEHEVPRATFTHPEVATVGYTESQAVAKFGQKDTFVLRTKLSEIDRAVAEGETRGFVKIIYNGKRKILGATVVAPVAGELASELGLAIKSGLLMKDIGTTMHAYPTWAFGLMVPAAAVYYEDVGTSSAFKAFRGCCARRLRGNPATLASVEMNDLRPH